MQSAAQSYKSMILSAVGVTVLGVALAAIANALMPTGTPWKTPPRPDKCGSQDKAGKLPRITPAQLKAALSKPGVAIFDARSVASYRAGHLPGARHLDFAGARRAARAGRTPAPIGHKIVIYCASPDLSASRKVAQTLAALGFKRISLLDGGVAAWRKNGFPVEKKPK